MASAAYRRSFPYVWAAFLIAASFFLLLQNSAFALTKEEVLSKYERVIVKSNQMNIYGYDLRDTTFKLKRITEILLENDLTRADRLLDEILRDLEVIETRGPEYLHRERKLAWLEVYGDLIQQFAIFVMIAFILLRFDFLKQSILSFSPPWSRRWKLMIAFTVASIFSGSLGLIRYGQSAWSFVDLQVVWIGISGLVGGVWVAAVVGLLGSFFRLFVATKGIYFLLPLAIGFGTGFLHRLYPKRPITKKYALFGGFFIGLLHGCFMYVPIFAYLPLQSFLYAVAFLSIVEAAVVFVFFAIALQIFADDRRKETEKELFRTRLQFLQAQINPHFLFNTLNTIASVCGEENASRARSLIIQLSTLFRRLTKREGDFVSLQDELAYIDAYLNIEKARFGDRLQIEKNIQLSEAGLATSVPILVLQPIVENAVKHGLSKKAEGGVLRISGRETSNSVDIEIHDTGIGMNEQTRSRLFERKGAVEDVENGDHAGIGLSNISERMTKLFGDRFKIGVTSEPGIGTTIEIQFPKVDEDD